MPEKAEEKQFYLKLWGRKLRNAIREVHDAYILLNWYSERVVWEFIRTDGCRYGRVAWRLPVTDAGCAEVMTEEGATCTARVIRSWRHTLKSFGYIAWRRTPAGLIVFVIGSEKFAPGHPRVKVAPLSDEELISEALSVRSNATGTRIEPNGQPPESAYQGAESCRSLVDSGPSVDQTGLSNIREEVESKYIKKSVPTSKINGDRVESSGGLSNRKGSTDFFYAGRKLRVTATQHESYVAKYPGIAVASEYERIDTKIVQSGLQRAPWASPKYIEKWFKNLADLKRQGSPMREKTPPKYGDEMYFQWMTPTMYSKWLALPHSERGQVFGIPFFNPTDNPEGLDERLREGLVYYRGCGNMAAAEEIERYFTGLDDGIVRDPKVAAGSVPAAARASNSSKARHSDLLQPMTHAEENRMAAKAWDQIMQTPEGAAVLGKFFFSKAPPSSNE